MSYLGSKQSVRAGAQLLDERRPGWHNDVSPDQLDIDSEQACVLGQLYGNFMAGREVLFSVRDNEMAYFTTGHSSAWNHGFVGRDTALLADFWRVEIAARRNPVDAP